jgi:hypothetical protein
MVSLTDCWLTSDKFFVLALIWLAEKMGVTDATVVQA